MKSTKPNLSLYNPTGGARDDSAKATSTVNAGELSLSSDADTIRLVALEYNDKLSIDEDSVDPISAPFDPYNNLNVRALDQKPRRSIDDLRKLSAEISKAKQYSNKRK